MIRAQVGDPVALHYTGKLADGTTFDSSRARHQPVRFELGAGQVIAGLEQAVQGMAVGDRKTVTIAADQAYGPRQAALVFRVNRQQVPTRQPLTVGMQLQLPTADGSMIPVMVLELAGEQVVLDGNHPLAGEILTFEIELLEVGGCRPQGK